VIVHSLNSISVSPGQSEHIAALPGIEVEAATMFPEADLPLNLRHRVTELSDLRAAIDDKRLWVAVTRDNRTVGFAMADVVDGQAYLEELDVLPTFGKMGIGTRLLQAVIEWARAGRYTGLTLITFRHLAWNGPFYEKLDFDYLDSTEHGPEIAGLIEEERLVGIDVTKRVAMRLTF